MTDRTEQRGIRMSDQHEPEENEELEDEDGEVLPDREAMSVGPAPSPQTRLMPSPAPRRAPAASPSKSVLLWRGLERVPSALTRLGDLFIVGKSLLR
jgi:hypothetical protein